MKVAILTMFRTLKSTYSLVGVVKSHVQMLLDGGVEIKILVSEECLDEEKTDIFLDSRIEWIKVANTYEGKSIEWKDYFDSEVPLDDNLDDKVVFIANEFKKYLGDVQICMLHDILYQSKHYIHNLAIRQMHKQLPHLRYIAFTHSFPYDRPSHITEKIAARYTALPNTIYAYPAQAGIHALAAQYDVPEGLCRVVYHSVALLEGMSSAVKRLHKQVDLLSSDILIIYPARLTTGKQLEKVVQLGGALSVIGNKSVKIIFCDFPCTDTEATSYKERIREIGIQYGLTSQQIVFTSEQGYPTGFPNESVLELFSLSNVYICPSMSESFGLTVLEAAREGNFIILNENVPSLKEIGKYLGAYFMKWDARCMGYSLSQTYEPSEATYYGIHARHILEELKKNSVIKAKTQIRQRFNKEWIWHHQMQPLIQELMQDE